MDEIKQFVQDRQNRIDTNKENKLLKDISKQFLQESSFAKYSYNFSWLGVPIIQYPQDIVAMQEIIWDIKPDMIIETGIAHGGSLIFYASMLSLLQSCGQIDDAKVLGIDIDIREHNKQIIQNHILSEKITMIQGSSIDSDIIKQVQDFAKSAKKILVCLDSNHTHSHVLAELKAYSPLVSIGSYCCVFDTFIEDMPENSFDNRPWDKGNNPKSAVKEFLSTNDNFVIDRDIENKLVISASPSGYLKRIK
jgi:cephalosporin hydroxylase